MRGQTRIYLRETTPETPTPERYLHMKRLLLTLGPSAVRAYLANKRRQNSGLLLGFILKFNNDHDRSDVGTGKCLNCLFRRNCLQSPTSCSFMDGRLPVRKLAFSVYNRETRRVMYEYDCGWTRKDGEPQNMAVMPDEIDIGISKEMFAWPITPFSLGMSPYRAVPRRGETRAAFDCRVAGVVDKIREMSGTGCVRTRLRRLFATLGKTKELRENYCDDVMFMSNDYWPGMSPDEILGMYMGGDTGVSPEDYLKNRKRLEAENAREEE